MKLAKIILIFCLLFQFRLAATIDAYEGHDYPYIEISRDPEELDKNIYDDNGLLNLKNMVQDFVLETKEIKIPGFPLAFNPCIVKWNNKILMSFRVRNDRGISIFEMGLVWLDRQFNPISTPQILQIPPCQLTSTTKHQDPRLVTIGDKLYIVYSNILDPVIGVQENRRMFFAEVQFDGTAFTASTPHCMTNFPGERISRWEKNWAPFDYKGNLLITYEIKPHRIFHPNIQTNRCDTVACTKGNMNWDWGVLRGGTPPQIDGDEYLGFFHTCKNLPTVQSDGKNITHYFFGAYTFANKAPFEITKISPDPIVAKDFYVGNSYNTWKPLRVVFPCGHIADKNFVWVSYGKQDHECWVVKLDKKKLLESLVPVETN